MNCATKTKSMQIESNSIQRVMTEQVSNCKYLQCLTSDHRRDMKIKLQSQDKSNGTIKGILSNRYIEN
jgi:hypothetical protein